MANYYLNIKAKANGSHEIHQVNCHYFPSTEDRILLGKFDSCNGAMAMAKQKYYPSKINGCFYCVNECHTANHKN